MASELIYRGHEYDDGAHKSFYPYFPKPQKPWFSVTRLIRYLLREQRFLFILLGVAISTLFFSLIPSSSSSSSSTIHPSFLHHEESFLSDESTRLSTRPRFSYLGAGFGSVSSKVPLGLKRKGLRVVVTGGMGFVGSHLVDRLIARGDSVIVVGNFFT